MGEIICSHRLEFKMSIIILAATFIISLCYGVVEGNNIINSKEKNSKVERKTNHLETHILGSIQSEDGDIIDCIDIYKQPAFDHPNLRTHTIQLTPSYDPAMDKNRALGKRKEENSDMSFVTSQTWQKSGRCPKGTIPMRRIQKNEMLKANSIGSYGRKKTTFSKHVGVLSNNGNESLLLNNHSKAILLTEGYSYSGAKGDMKVWNPHVEADDEYTTSRVSLLNGPHQDFECVESGWAVNPSVYGDRKTRLYVYWTADSSNRTGCFDLTCPGFVQTSNEIALGAAIYPISVPRGLPYQITLYIFKDFMTNNWWVQYGERINIGYWPPELFISLSHSADAVEWGGEVYSARLGSSPHTATAMGNGQFPDYVFGESGCFKRMRIRDNSLILKFPDWVQTFADEYDCYGVEYVGDYIDDPEFYFGGPGRNPMCP